MSSIHIHGWCPTVINSAYTYQCSPQHTKGILAQYPFTMDFSLMWEWGGAKSFDVAAGSTQNMPFQYALPLVWGEHCVFTAQTWPRSDPRLVCMGKDRQT